jgi:hypothetical protein
MNEDRLLSQLGRIEDKLDENTKQTIENTASLKEHMRRTALLEERHAAVDSRLAPLEKHVDGIAATVKFIGIISLVTATILGIVQLVRSF